MYCKKTLSIVNTKSKKKNHGNLNVNCDVVKCMDIFLNPWWFHSRCSLKNLHLLLKDIRNWNRLCLFWCVFLHTHVHSSERSITWHRVQQTWSCQHIQIHRAALFFFFSLTERISSVSSRLTEPTATNVCAFCTQASVLLVRVHRSPVRAVCASVGAA